MIAHLRQQFSDTVTMVMEAVVTFLTIKKHPWDPEG